MVQENSQKTNIIRCTDYTEGMLVEVGKTLTKSPTSCSLDERVREEEHLYRHRQTSIIIMITSIIDIFISTLRLFVLLVLLLNCKCCCYCDHDYYCYYSVSLFSWLLLYFYHCNYQYQEKRQTILSTKKSLQRYGPCLGLLECRVQRFWARVYKTGASNLPSASPMVHTQNPQPNIRPSALSPISYPNTLNPIS